MPVTLLVMRAAWEVDTSAHSTRSSRRACCSWSACAAWAGAAQYQDELTAQCVRCDKLIQHGHRRAAIKTLVRFLSVPAQQTTHSADRAQRCPADIRERGVWCFEAHDGSSTLTQLLQAGPASRRACWAGNPRRQHPAEEKDTLTTPQSVRWDPAPALPVSPPATPAASNR